MLILLTGSTGFIGSRLVGELREAGHTVHELVRYLAGGRYHYYDRDNVHFADLRDADSVRSVVHKVEPELLIHLAAESAVSYSFSRPHEVLAVNTAGTMALADAAADVHVGLFIHASSSEVYGNQTQFPTPEDARLNATSPYAVAKIAAEEYLRVVAAARGLKVLIMRPFNTYGRALIGNRHFVVERAICQALECGAISLHNPRPLRDFLFRDDHVSAYKNAVERWGALAGQTINVASGCSWNIHSMAWAVARLTGPETTVSFGETPDRPHDIDRLEGDPTRARELLHWKPQYELTSGLSRAMTEWKRALAR